MAEFDIDSNMSELLLKLTGDATVRGTITSDGEYMGSVYDFMDLACPNMSPSWTSVTWRNLIAEKSEFKDEIKFTMVFLKYENLGLRNGKKTRNRKTPVMTLRGLQRLMMILGGNVAAEFRHIVEGVFTRYMAGDKSMLEEIRSNAASDAPIHQAYRQALAQEPVVDTAATKRMLDHDEALFTIELHERYMTLHERSWALYEKSMALQRRT